MTTPNEKLREVLRPFAEEMDEFGKESNVERILTNIAKHVQAANLAVVDLETHVVVPKETWSNLIDAANNLRKLAALLPDYEFEYATEVESAIGENEVNGTDLNDLLDAKAEHWRKWAIQGMPADKMRLAEATWQAAVDACANTAEAHGLEHDAEPDCLGCGELIAAYLREASND